MNFKHLYYTEAICPMKAKFAGLTINGVKVVIPIVAGEVEGEVINGEIMSLGADWNTIRYNISSKVMARYIIKTDDGALINLFTDGIMKFKLQKIINAIKKKSLNLSDYMYFREYLYFSTSDKRYAWLNDANCFAIIGIKIKFPNFLICYDAYGIID